MGRVVITEFITLDGVMEDPGGAEGFEHGGWSFKFNRGEDGDRFKVDELMAADAQLLGRVTYEGFAKAWPSIEAGAFGERMNSMPKYVVSSTLDDETADWQNSTVLRGDLQQDIEALKRDTERDILVAGSARLVQGLAALGQIDEYRLMLFPLILGSGRRLFDGSSHTSLKLIEQGIVGSDGVMTLRYAPGD